MPASRLPSSHTCASSPDWAGLFYVQPVELNEQEVSAN
jgi:hypothetical protein